MASETDSLADLIETRVGEFAQKLNSLEDAAMRTDAVQVDSAMLRDLIRTVRMVIRRENAAMKGNHQW